MEGDHVNESLHVLNEHDKSRFDTYSVRGVPLCKNMSTLKQYLLDNCWTEIYPVTGTSFQLGYYGEAKKKFSMTSKMQLAEVFSLAKNNYVTLLVDPHEYPPRASSGKKREKVLFKNGLVMKQATFRSTAILFGDYHYWSLSVINI